MSAKSYYDSLLGSWEGRFRLRVTDWPVLRARSLVPFLTGTSAHYVGGMPMKTTLAKLGEGRYRHTTRVSSFGLPMFSTEETIVIGGDGRSLRMSGEQRSRVGGTVDYDADGEVDETSTRATYRLRWLGDDMVQTTHIVDGGDGLELVQETAWSHAEVLLQRNR